MHEDKRATPRSLYSEPVFFALPEVSVNGSIAGNISLSGISIKVQGFVPVGVILELQLRFGQSPKVIWTKAKVVRVRQVLADDCYEIGLKFVRDEEVTKAIGAFIYASRFESTKELKNYG
jgi:hypothetical protein